MVSPEPRHRGLRAGKFRGQLRTGLKPQCPGSKRTRSPLAQARPPPSSARPGLHLGDERVPLGRFVEVHARREKKKKGYVFIKMMTDDPI